MLIIKIRKRIIEHANIKTTTKILIIIKQEGMIVVK